MGKDIKALISIYTILILIGWIIGLKYSHSKEARELNQELLEAKKVVILLDERLSLFEDVYRAFIKRRNRQ